MKVLILEDEPIHAKYLAKLLNSILELPIAEIIHATSLEMAYSYYRQSTIDLFFLDLNIFGSDGFHFLDKFPNETMKTIVVSANTDIAIRAFEYGVLDFLEKPVSEERLRLALERYFLRTKTNQKETSNQNYVKSRLLQVDIDKLESRLSELMEIKKVYQNEDLSLETLAEELELHPRQLSEFLNGIKLTSFNSFLHSYRIKEAKELLIKYPDRKVSDIGFEVGYKSLSSFYDAFKKEQKITTSEFRQKTLTT
ncbi:response regulator transcription factor [Leptospira harrisiae]|uniref:Two-component system response regulator n=1 Tax=Leptospira harrisiae TaxID=2023189 RepID=A0A2N0AIZ3_9LEPT|nr:helix-turn-helix domain-containing protein [Leptospira harrisiae]PJZ84254.1 two-component system response regulator [Leptospira harrisiae]PKA07830.1 two-component system response regulator [Leptospira harrisiae]